MDEVDKEFASAFLSLLTIVVGGLFLYGAFFNRAMALLVGGIIIACVVLVVLWVVLTIMWFTILDKGLPAAIARVEAWL